jgi:hypothetical protein
MAKELTREHLTLGLETEILGLGHYQQDIEKIENFGFKPD